MNKILRYTIFYGMMFGALGGSKIAHHQQAINQRPTAGIAASDTNHRLTPRQQERKGELLREIENIKFYVWHERDQNLGRIKLAQLNIELAFLDVDNQSHHLEEARLAVAGAGPDERLRFHQSGQYVRDYFEVQLQLASAYTVSREFDRALGAYDRIFRELENPDLLLAQQIHDYSVPGYRSRAQLELALLHMERGSLDQAQPLLASARDWARGEAAQSGVTLWWRNENSRDINYIEARASINLIRIALISGDRPGALADLSQIIMIPGTGQADGFMDIGFETLLYTLWTCLEMSPDVGSAQSRFSSALPWDRINNYRDLINALGYPNGLPSDNTGLWTGVLTGLMNVELTQHQRDLLLQITMYTENH